MTLSKTANVQRVQRDGRKASEPVRREIAAVDQRVHSERLEQVARLERLERLDRLERRERLEMIDRLDRPGGGLGGRKRR
ncbi:MAG TPA: hypothetical protein VHK44_05070 [Xanthobacteraceae bacterium]|nr:hypothetical protein [Xanthobacteraceae bacterium]